MAFVTMNSTLKQKCFDLLIIAALTTCAQSLCEITDKGKTRTEKYKNCDPSYIEEYERWFYGCTEEEKIIVIGPTTFSCFNSSINEIHSSHIKQEDTKTHFLVKNSFINILVADTKTWPRLTKLYLEQTNTSTIIPGFFNSFTELTELSITCNKIREVADGVFSPLVILERLILSNNLISQLGLHSFVGLSKLTMLDLSKNQIVALKNNVLLPLVSINYLNLTENLLSELGNNLNLSSLKEVNLRHNNLTKIDFLNITTGNLNIIDVSHNNLTHIANLDIFQADTVNLDSNNIEVLKRIGKISKFSISKNRIRILQDNFSSDSVAELDLSFNNIAKISEKSFLQSSELKTLILNHNNLSSLPISCFKSLRLLEHLDLSYNTISYSEYGIFNNLKNLKYLNVSHNMGIIDFHAFSRLFHLEIIDFKNNDVKNLDLFFLETHNNLREITMGENSWICSDLAKIIHLMEQRNIAVIEGSVDHSSNIHGIGCKSSFKNIYLYKNKTQISNEQLSSDQFDTSTDINFLNVTDRFSETLYDVTKKTTVQKAIDIKASGKENPLLGSFQKEVNKNEKNSYNVLNLVISNTLLLVIACSLVGIIIMLKRRVKSRSFKEEVELIG